MSAQTNASIAAQRQAIENGQQTLPVLRPCRLGDGILSITEDQQERYRQTARFFNEPLHFFIPASGSGSRMFAFLFDYLQHPDAENTKQAERFFSRLPDFALFRQLPQHIQTAYLAGELTLSAFIEVLMGAGGLNFGALPKGLISFHIHEPFVLNAFQEHLSQVQALAQGPIHFHFTIQEDFHQAFEKCVAELAALTGQNYQVTYSSQDKNTDAYVFDQQQQLVTDAKGQALRRPAGHGTLLQNLETIQSPYVLVKNIDNIQHFDQRQASNANWEFLLGLQIEIRSALRQFVATADQAGFAAWNERMGLLDSAALVGLALQDWQALLNRPLRVCGMVRNDGQPGGGPFFVEMNGVASKQIVEKAQLHGHPQASKLMLQSAYFNPVLMVLSPCDLSDNPLPLQQFADPNTYFVVEKNQGGERVYFVEQPGLWNGAMANWNTLFVEVPSAVFSPVKSALDLLDFAHQANKGA
ncbi:MAG: DUF4301 family protein [Crocinitomicaceae bacterium]|nr:DUF4301 family protein [Crocinitomicaceae bacterium]